MPVAKTQRKGRQDAPPALDPQPRRKQPRCAVDEALKSEEEQQPPVTSTAPTKQPSNARYFTVTSVAPSTQPLPAFKPPSTAVELAAMWGGGDVKAASAAPANAVSIPYEKRCCENPFAQAVALAFFDHYPLELSPEAVWLAIMQGFAQHVKNNSEALRSHFVAHQGKEEVEVVNPRLTWTSPPELWAASIPGFRDAIQKHLKPDQVGLLCPRFSTSTVDTDIAVTVTLMDMMQHYFAYGLRGGCGIPSIALLGTTSDWEAVLQHAQGLRPFQCAEWVDELELVLREFVAASKGEVNREFWARTATHFAGSGTEVPFTGWVNVFFPYVKCGLFTGEKIPAALKASAALRVRPISEFDTVTFSVHLLSNSKPKRVKCSKNATLGDLMIAGLMDCGPLVLKGTRVRDLTTTVAGAGIKDDDSVLVTAGEVELYLPNPALTSWRDGGHGINPSLYPKGINSAPVTFTDVLGGNTKYPISFQAGFTGVEQDAVTLAVKPVVGWAVTTRNA